MGKKKNRNKKMKIRCPSCNKKNIFSKENWEGEDKTNCKYCGTKLNAKKTYQPPITNPNKSISKIKSPDSFHEATRPSSNLGKKNSRRKTIVVWSLAIVLAFAFGYILDNQDINTLDKVNNLNNESDLIPPITEQDLCSEITKVPAWCQDGEIIDYGYKPEWNVTYLVDNKICFLYSATCSWCHKQIEEFGDQWETYILSGYTNKCW